MGLPFQAKSGGQGSITNKYGARNSWAGEKQRGEEHLPKLNEQGMIALIQFHTNGKAGTPVSNMTHYITDVATADAGIGKCDAPAYAHNNKHAAAQDGVNHVLYLQVGLF